MTYLQIKPGVRVRGLSPEIMLAITIAQASYERCGEESMTITSLTDGKHSDRSLHYCGDAVDLRLPLDPDVIPVLVNFLKVRLGESYDVVLEKDHIHVEFDPK